MGANQSLQYSVAITNNNKPGETEIYRNPLTKDKLIPFPSPEIRTTSDIVQQGAKKFAKCNCLGTKISETEYQWKTYEECARLASLIGTGILEKNLAPEVKEYENLSLRFISIFSKNREEYLLVDMACCLYGIVSVPIYDTFGPSAVEYIFEQTSLSTIFLSQLGLESMLKFGKRVGKVETLISFDKITEDEVKKCQAIGYKLLTFSEIYAKEPASYPTRNPEDIMTFSYTSGTTGNPKGAMISYGNIVSVSASLDYTDLKIGPKDVHLSYLPLAHVLERIIVWCFLLKGGTIGFFGGDVQKLKDDLGLLKPTFFASVPRLYNRFYDLMKGGIKKLGGIKRALAERAINSKLYYLKYGTYYKYKLYDMLVFSRMKQALGGNLKIMITGSAPISGEVLDFLKIACSCPILEGYGQTESTGASFCTKANDPTSGHVGGPTSNTEFKLIDVPEMSYTSKDVDSDGNPLPRGELCMRGFGVFKGYYKDRAKTDETIDKDGWLFTGDIVQLNQNGSIKIIDRKKNIFKLAQGEYVAAEKIEICYNKCEAVDEIFVYGDSLQAYLVGVTVPNRKFVLEAAKKNNIEGQFEDLIKRNEIKKEILENMNKQAKSEKLMGFEMVRKLFLFPEPFAVRELVTSTFKLKRHEAKLYFANEIKAMYDEPEGK